MIWKPSPLLRKRSAVPLRYTKSTKSRLNRNEVRKIWKVPTGGGIGRSAKIKRLLARRTPYTKSQLK